MKKFIALSLVAMLALSPLSFAASDTETTTKIDVIAERTAATGVTVDGVLLKDGVVEASAISAFVPADGANTACDTTCGIAGALVAYDAGTNAFVAVGSALADSCICDGATS